MSKRLAKAARKNAKFISMKPRESDVSNSKEPEWVFGWWLYLSLRKKKRKIQFPPVSEHFLAST